MKLSVVYTFQTNLSHGTARGWVDWNEAYDERLVTVELIHKIEAKLREPYVEKGEKVISLILTSWKLVYEVSDFPIIQPGRSSEDK